MATVITAPVMDSVVGVINSAIITPKVASAFALRNTATRDPSTDATLLLADLRFHPAHRLLFYDSTLDQSVTLTLVASFDGLTIFVVGAAQTVAIGNVTEQLAFVDSATLAQLANSYPYLGIQIKATVAPTVGTLTVGFAAASV